jgi:site-specific DNA recombinase
MMPVSAPRCAIYTRKSTEEGLEQAFNSLDAQREACEAYVKSQAHEGWKQISNLYDDGGFSGGTMERPALKRLMEDIENRRVDIVVVYKVDRLTRSLADFAKMVEAMDRYGASFVSVTQQFNTTSSMGRLTLNVLLSFAQFEREITGERIRDKIAASKRRGLWMGGNVPLGYDVCAHELIVNEREAATVRTIFSRYLEVGRVAALRAVLATDGIESKIRVSQKGSARGGLPYSRGALYAILRNRVYIGLMPHRTEAYPGHHVPIIDSALWGLVQSRLSGNRADRGGAKIVASGSPLAGFFFDDCGNLMSPSFCKKGTSRRYRYYVSQGILRNEKAAVGSVGRIPASLIEDVVADAVRPHLLREGSEDRWRAAPKRISLRDAIERVTISAKGVEIILRGCSVKRLHVSGIIVRHGRRLVFENLAAPLSRNLVKPSRALVRAMCKAHYWLGLIERGEIRSYYELARRENMNPGYVRRVMQLAFLSPKLVEEILDSRETICGGVVEITEMVMPLSWAQQADLLKKGPRRPAEHVSGQSYLAHIEADDKFWGGVSE